MKHKHIPLDQIQEIIKKFQLSYADLSIAVDFDIRIVLQELNEVLSDQLNYNCLKFLKDEYFRERKI